MVDLNLAESILLLSQLILKAENLELLVFSGFQIKVVAIVLDSLGVGLSG